MPQLNMRERQSLTVSAAKTRSPVIGHTPPDARVPATQDMARQSTSMEQSGGKYRVRVRVRVQGSGFRV